MLPPGCAADFVIVRFDGRGVSGVIHLLLLPVTLSSGICLIKKSFNLFLFNRLADAQNLL
jgi:hypothetical protein